MKSYLFNILVIFVDPWMIDPLDPCTPTYTTVIHEQQCIKLPNNVFRIANIKIFFLKGNLWFLNFLGPALCSNENEERYTKDLLGSESFNEVTFGYFFIFQIIFSMVTISFITHGLSYVDDHISAKHGPALLGSLHYFLKCRFVITTMFQG